MRKEVRICPNCGSGNAHKPRLSAWPSNPPSFHCSICDTHSYSTLWEYGFVVLNVDEQNERKLKVSHPAYQQPVFLSWNQSKLAWCGEVPFSGPIKIEIPANDCKREFQVGESVTIVDRLLSGVTLWKITNIDQERIVTLKNCHLTAQYTEEALREAIEKAVAL